MKLAVLSRLGTRFRMPYLLLGAAFTALTLIFPQIGLLEWITMIPLMIGVYRLCEDSTCSLKKAYGYGFVTVYVFYFIIYHWITYLYPLDFLGMDAGSSLAIIAAGWLGLPLLQALLGGFLFLLFRLLHKIGLFAQKPLLRPFLFAALWVIFEWSSTLGWTGVPWGRLCLGQSELLPILQSSALLGSYFVTWLIVAVNGLAAYAILYHGRTLLCTALAASLFLANLLYGAIAVSAPADTTGETVRVAVVQGNINSHDKWAPDSMDMIRQIYGDYTRRAAEDGAELVIWPETTFPFVLTPASSIGRFVSSLARECNIALVVGALHYDEEGNLYNALFWVEPDGTVCNEVYAKRHLVPFGEYVPMRDLIMTLIPPLANVSALDEDLTPGNDPALFDSEWGRVGSLICFDSIYEQLTLDSVRNGAELMILSSNDSWFFDSAAVYQHQVQAQLRAIESGRYLVRSGNTGVSAVISPKGECLAWIDPLVDGYAVAEVQMINSDTLYTKVGNLFVSLCIGTVVALGLGSAWTQLCDRRRQCLL
ncbi:MAG: apolipoprotein N-acyltransferase [Clostridia bacterium]|nr:apolipoprotein N-acyltransferase [Clostridia bacterium]